ncbi:MAG: UDP-glucose 4-epimerase [Porticoccaceae bacterium]|nr:MAG: UDP-glucose 4-epimerase [Porticoccaceae bacterium]
MARAAPRRILLTGASGFVGRGLLAAGLARADLCWRVAVRRPVPLPPGVEAITAPLDAPGDWSAALAGVDAVIHLAACHRRGASARELERVNVQGTALLARAAAAAGVRRFILVSSLKAMGEESPPGRPWRGDEPARPTSAYGRSKLAAEEAARDALADRSELVVVRPPLVYGPGVGGLFGRLLRWLDRGLPLPDSRAARSFVALPNLADLLLILLDHPAAPERIWLAADSPPMALRRWLAALARRLHRPLRLLPEPTTRPLGRLAPGFASRWWQPLAVDPTPLAALGWQPPLSRRTALSATVAALRGELPWGVGRVKRSPDEA